MAGAKLSRKDFDSGADVRWCPGCGDYSILANVQRAFPTLGVDKEKFVFISGIGCSSRFPYYMNTYGFHTIHGRAPAFATGLKVARPDLHVWVVTGDGDALSIGGNHLLHVLRRNVNVKVLLFNNRIYGLTKGQYSPTSETGKVTKSTPLGSVDAPLRPLSVAVGAEATFIARCVDTDAKMMQSLLAAAHAHEGTAFIEILQNCNVFNDGAFVQITDRSVKADRQLLLEDGKPMLYGADHDHAVGMREGQLVWGKLGEDVAESEVLTHDAQRSDPGIAFMLARLETPAPTPMGILRSVSRPTYDGAVQAQLSAAREGQSADLHGLLHAGDTWVVE